MRYLVFVLVIPPSEDITTSPNQSVQAGIQHPALTLGLAVVIACCGLTIQFEDLVIGGLDAEVGAVNGMSYLPPARRQSPRANHPHVIGRASPDKCGGKPLLHLNSNGLAVSSYHRATLSV